MINNELFKIKFETFHPVIDKYSRISYWRTMKKFCMEGYWVGNTWMCGELFYYINFHNINKEKGTYKGLGLPDLRDIDWMMFNTFTEAIGFSGFEDDEEFTCHRGIQLIEKGESTKEDIILDYCTDEGVRNDVIYKALFKQDGTPKKYVEARDYLNKIHKKQLGKPLYHNEAKHLLLLGARGFGKSFSASGLIAHNFLFDGSHDYDLYFDAVTNKKRLKSETAVGAIDAKYSGDLLDKVKTAFLHLPDKHEIYDGRNLKVYPSLLEKEITGSFQPSKKVEASDSKSVIHHRTLQDNPLVFNGTRPNRAFIDEVGFVNNLLESWESLENTQAAEKFKRLTIYGMGTGGLTTSGAATYAQEIFYNPEAYNCLVFDDIWENKGKIGKFIPVTHALNKYKEGKNLITNEARALAEVNKEREKAKKSRSKTKLLSLIINKPLVPSEIFLRMEGNFFPTQDLKECLVELESNKLLLDSSWKVDLHIDGTGKVKTRPSNKLPIRDYPLTKNVDMDACIEIFEKPKTNADDEAIPDRYYLVLDPVDDDGNSDIKRSLQSTWVYDSVVDRLVAEYTARTEFASEYYENVRKLALYYNAYILYENNKKGFYGHMKNKDSLYMLLPVPEILKEQNFVKAEGIGNKSLGVNMTSDKLKLWAINDFKEWMCKKAYSESSENSEKKNMHTFRSPALLKECIAFTMSLNCDRVSALLILMILIADKKRMFEDMKQLGISSEEEMRDRNFWKRAYKGTNKTANVYRNYNPLSKLN